MEMSHTQLHAAAGQSRQRLGGGAEFGHHPQVGFEIEQLGKAGADDLVIVDEGNLYHDVSLKSAARVLARPTRYLPPRPGSRESRAGERDRRRFCGKA